MADITYILNDPSTPSLMIPVDLPPKPAVLDFKVDGYRGATPLVGTLEHQAACIYYSIVRGINLVNSVLQTPITGWAATQSLYVQPRAGKQFNAYYDRQALRFFYAQDPVAQKMIYAADSADVTLHEFGHAILDAIRPDLYNLQCMEVWSYHESFGDQNAIMNLLQHEEILDFMLAETNGDIRLTNIASKLAEEMGTAIFNVTGGRMGHVAGYMRNAVNPFKYVIPETLPRNGLDTQLTCEPHSFSRVFTGAWYDILVAIYEKEKAAGKPAKEALKLARDTMTTYTYRCLRLAPATIRFFDAIARAMLICDKANNYAYNVEMNQVFINRGILREMVRPMVNLDWMAFATQIEPADEVMKTDEGSAIVRTKGTQTLPMPFYRLTCEAPGDTAFEFDKDGSCINVTAVSGLELVEHAHQCVDFLKQHDMIRSDKQSPFELTQDGLLVRSHFACGCGATVTKTCGNSVSTKTTRGGCGCVNNASRPGQPEFGKPWKRENNSGCCGTCKTVEPCGTQPTNPKGLLPGQMQYIKSPTLVGTCAGPAILPGGSIGGAPADGGTSIAYNTSGGAVSKLISSHSSRYSTSQCVKTVGADGISYKTACTTRNVTPTPPVPPVPPEGEAVAEFNYVSMVPSNVPTTVVNYIVPTGKTFHVQGFAACGDTDAYFRLYVNGVTQITARTTQASLTANETLATPVLATEGQTVILKVTHWHAGLELEFEGTIMGYLT